MVILEHFSFVDFGPRCIFSAGDANLVANRQFLIDLGGSKYAGVIVEALDDIIAIFNSQHTANVRISYNISSSTPATEFFKQMHGDNDADLDCMFCMSIFNNKKKYQNERPPLLNQSALAIDYMHHELERPKQLTNYDLFVSGAPMSPLAPSSDCQSFCPCYKKS